MTNFKTHSLYLWWCHAECNFSWQQN